jgi:hypothetical protein
LKNQVNGRKKRDVGEALEPVYQNGPLDYEELLQSLNEDYLQMPAEKRYLGELSRLMCLRDKFSQVMSSKNCVDKSFEEYV